MPFVSALKTLLPDPILTVTPSIDPAVIDPRSALIAARLSTLILSASTESAASSVAVIEPSTIRSPLIKLLLAVHSVLERL